MEIGEQPSLHQKGLNAIHAAGTPLPYTFYYIEAATNTAGGLFHEA
jgi:hypothetical protein